MCCTGRCLHHHWDRVLAYLSGWNPLKNQCFVPHDVLLQIRSCMTLSSCSDGEGSAGSQARGCPADLANDLGQLQKVVLWNRNRNRRNRNFLPCVTGTVTCQKVRTGTVTNYGSETVIIWYHISLTDTQYKIQFNSTDFLFDFLNLIHTGYNRLSG